MFLVISNDYERQTQKLLYKTTDFYFAIDHARQFAENFVIEKKGNQLDPYRVKSYGFFIRPSKKCFKKFGVFYKEKDGYVISGITKKVLSVFVIKTPIDNLPQRGESNFIYKSMFEECLQELLIITEEVTAIEEINNKV